ncbi:MAG: RNA polymerase sigma factor [Opitutales bacterium]
MTDEPSNPTDYEPLVDAYYTPLYRFAYSLTKNEHEAGDLTQQTFVIYAQKGHTIQDASKVKSWLFTTLYREFLRLRRKLGRVDTQDNETLEFSAPSVPADAVRSVDAQLAVEALQSVDEVYRAPLSLFYLEDASYKEIAETLDVPIGTVMSRLSRGKAQLKEVFLARERDHV